LLPDNSTSGHWPRQAAFSVFVAFQICKVGRAAFRHCQVSAHLRTPVENIRLVRTFEKMSNTKNHSHLARQSGHKSWFSGPGACCRCVCTSILFKNIAPSTKGIRTNIQTETEMIWMEGQYEGARLIYLSRCPQRPAAHRTCQPQSGRQIFPGTISGNAVKSLGAPVNFPENNNFSGAVCRPLLDASHSQQTSYILDTTASIVSILQIQLYNACSTGRTTANRSFASSFYPPEFFHRQSFPLYSIKCTPS
jgi:hypothetical protein